MSNTPDYSDLFASLDQAVAAAPAAPKPAPVFTPGAGGPEVAALSRAMTTPTVITVPGMTRPFRPHQCAAYEYVLGAVDRWGAALVGDAMGLGKTQVALAYIAHRLSSNPGYALVIAPPVTVKSWRDDIAASFPGLTFAHIKGRKADRIGDRVVLPKADVIFISDDPLTLRAWLTNGLDAQRQFNLTNVATEAQVVVRDEIHRDKGADGKPSSPTARARLMMTVGAALQARRTPIIGMTGTLLVNRPIDALLPLQVLGGAALVKALTPGAKSVIGFAYRYCNPTSNGYGTDWTGADKQTLPQLHDLLRRTVYVRREMRDLGDVVPEARWQTKPMALNGVLARYKRIQREFLTLVMEEEGPEAMWRKARAEVLTRMTALIEEAGLAAASATAEYVSDIVGESRDRQCVVFYVNTSVRDAIAKHLDDEGITHATISGKVTGDRRSTLIEGFQQGGARVVLVQFRAGGMGVTLTAAADAVMAQLPWSAGDLAQAAGRILRVDGISLARAQAGEAVTWHVPLACLEDGTPTIAGLLWQVQQAKADVCDAVNSGREVTIPQDSIVHSVLTAWFAQQSA